jgi:hypothetical protein
MNTTTKTIALLCLLTAVSCGRNDDSNSSSPSAHAENQPNEGFYRAILRPVNPTLAGWIPNGKVDINIDAEHFEVKSWLDDSAAVPHPQAIHLGTRCPTSGDDRNNDGIIDSRETLIAAKSMLIPLDDDLASQSAGLSYAPKGNYSYSRRSPLLSLVSDLTGADENPQDHISKLAQGKSLDLAGRVIIVYGIAQNKDLPTSVQTIEGQTAQQSIPVACGKIERLKAE